jgi:CheY-like chemotaxis protein
MAHVIVADANQGRRSLLANTLEREGFQITRVSNLRQAVGTTAATVPEVLLLEESWPEGDALEAAQAIASNPAVGARTRVLLLSRDTSQEGMILAARSGIAEVLSKPIDMSRLIAQVRAHAEKRTVAPPANLPMQGMGGGGFSPGFAAPLPAMDDGSWAMPVLRGLLGSNRLNADLLRDVMPEAVGLDEDPEGLVELVRRTMARLVEANEDAVEPESSGSAAQAPAGPSIDDLTKSVTLGSAEPSDSTGKRAARLDGGGMQDALQRQADQIANEVEQAMDDVLDESPPTVTEAEDAQAVDKETLAYVRLCIEDIRDLLWDLGRPGALSDLTLMTRLEDATGFAEEVLKVWPSEDKA